MSFCRWSSDGFQCDVYAYAAEWGYLVHVAGKRRPRRVTDPMDGVTSAHDPKFQEKVLENLKKQRQELNDPTNQPVPINGPCDGQTFGCDSPEELLHTLQRLVEDGYFVPESTFLAVAEEITEKNRCIP